MSTLEGVSHIIAEPHKLEYHFTIHEMPLDERPRERLRNYGPEALATAELIGIILRTGTTRDNAVEMSAKLLAKYGGLRGMFMWEIGGRGYVLGVGGGEGGRRKAGFVVGCQWGALQKE